MTETPPRVSPHHIEADRSRPEPRCDVGVLLVHGIGDHKEGETLTGFGEPLLDWIRAWLRKGAKDADVNPVSLSGARLRAARNEAESPAYAEAVIRDRQEREERWLLCEAWWGEAVRPPDALRLLLWLWSRGPLLIFWHFYVKNEPRAPQTHAEKERLGMQIFAAIALGGACQLVVTIALLLWLIPIGKWRGAVASAVRALTLTLGDSYVLLEHDIQRAALVERVQRSLEWLAKRCTTVAVVAHSQGGAIAHEALVTADRVKVAAFVSVGSGLEKLLFLRMVRRDGTGVIAASLVAPSLFLAAGFGVYGLSPAGAPWHVIPAVLCLMLAIGLMASLATASNTYRSRLARDAARLALHRTTAALVSWTDIAASRDLVPQVHGSLISGQPFVDGHVTTNERSYLYDHTGYFQSPTSAMPQIWRALSQASSLSLFDKRDAARLERFDALHRRHAGVLVFARWMTYAALFVGLFAFRNTMVVFGGRIFEGLAASPFKDLLKPVRAVGDGTAWLVHSATGITASGSDVSPALIGALALLLAIALWSLLFKGIWRLLAARRWRLACEGGSVLDTVGGVWRARLACLLLGAASTVPLLWAMTMIAAPALLQPTRLGVAVAAVLVTMCVCAAVLTAALVPWLWSLDWPVAGASAGDLEVPAPAETLAHPVSGVLLITLLTICGVFVRAQVSDGSNAWIIVGVALVHATSWQVYGLCRPAGDVGLLARLSIVVFPAAALLAAWQSGFDGEQVALVYVGVAIAVSIAAVLSRRRRYVRKALPIAMKELWRNVRTYR